MKITERSLTATELEVIKKVREKSIKKLPVDSLIGGILTLFGLLILLFLFEKLGLNIPSKYAKPSLVGLSIISAIVYLVRSLLKLNAQSVARQKVFTYKFTITDYYYENISNTEFIILACQTTDNKTVVFQSQSISPETISDTFEIDILNGKIVSVDNYSSGKPITQLNLNMQLIDKYDEEFYILDQDIHSL